MYSDVDFTFQTEGRYNLNKKFYNSFTVDFTFKTEVRYN